MQQLECDLISSKEIVSKYEIDMDIVRDQLHVVKDSDINKPPRKQRMAPVTSIDASKGTKKSLWPRNKSK